jgi:hypothetical protein
MDERSTLLAVQHRWSDMHADVVEARQYSGPVEIVDAIADGALRPTT